MWREQKCWWNEGCVERGLKIATRQPMCGGRWTKSASRSTDVGGGEELKFIVMKVDVWDGGKDQNILREGQYVGAED